MVISGKRRVLVWMMLLVALSVRAESVLHVKGESLTPAGTTISLEWQVEGRDNSYVFYLNRQKKAEMFSEDGKIVKIRRCVRFAGKDKWIVLTDPFQIALELKSGFYPFSAILNYRRNRSRETILASGRFEILQSETR